jgi:hypothetical protein
LPGEHWSAVARSNIRPISRAAHGSLMTLCWRKTDSNFWSHLKRKAVAELAPSFFEPGRDGFNLRE